MQENYLSKIGMIFRDTQQFQLLFSSPLKLHKTIYLCNLQPWKKRSPVIFHKIFLADKCEQQKKHCLFPEIERWKSNSFSKHIVISILFKEDETITLLMFFLPQSVLLFGGFPPSFSQLCCDEECLMEIGVANTTQKRQQGLWSEW